MAEAQALALFLVAQDKICHGQSWGLGGWGVGGGIRETLEIKRSPGVFPFSLLRFSMRYTLMHIFSTYPPP